MIQRMAVTKDTCKGGRPKKDVDWDAFKAEFVEGKTIPMLAAKYGISHHRAYQVSRVEGWKDERIAFVEQLKGSTPEIVEKMVQDEVAALTERIKRLADKGFRFCEENDINTIDGAVKYSQAVEKLNSIARQNLGMDKDSKATIVNLNVLHDFEPGFKMADAIEV